MATPPRHAVLRLTPWTVVRAVAMLGLTIAILGIASRSARVIGWLLAAGVLAGLFFPLVQTLDKRVPRAVALLVVVLGSIGLVAVISFEVVHEVAQQVHELQRAVPAAARALERSDRFGRTARDLR